MQDGGTGPGGVAWMNPWWTGLRPMTESSVPVDPDRASRAYQHWHLAAELTVPTADGIRLGTAVHKLWNAAESRLRLLHEEYRLAELRRVLGWDRKTDTLWILERLDLARPLVLRQLKSIRNAVEHADRGVPPFEEVVSFVDSVWYFLRSTDVYVAYRVTTFLYEDRAEADGAFAEFDLDVRSWMPRLRASFPAPHLHREPHAGAVEVVLDEPPRVDGRGSVVVTGVVAAHPPVIGALAADYFRLDLPDGTRRAV